MTMFIICGKGGKADESAYLQEPWRIVSPALFFFVVMTIFSIVNLVIIETGMNTLCKSFKAEVSDVSCSASLNHFMMAPREKFNLPPGKTWIILTIFNYFTLFSWLISALILVARIIFVIDFQLMRVTVKTVEYENSKDSSNLKVIEIEDHKTDGK